MSKKNGYNFINPLHAKDYYMDEAWEYFKKRENIPANTERVAFEQANAGKDINERWGAFKHTYTSAAFTKNYNESVAKLFGDANEIQQIGLLHKDKKTKEAYAPGNVPQDRRMDLKNNANGRKIGLRYSGENLLDEVYYALDNDSEIILNQNVNNDTPYNDTPFMNRVWKLADKGYENKEEINNLLKGHVDFSRYLGNPESLKEKLIRFREEKLKRYTERLAQSPEKTKELESKHVSLEELKAPQEARRKRVRDIIEGKVEFDENNELKSYENKKSGDNKIFTKEDIEQMSDEERKKNKEAIAYQRRTIGIPTRQQAEKSVAKGGMVHVSAYTRSDGTHVKSYYRSR